MTEEINVFGRKESPQPAPDLGSTAISKGVDPDTLAAAVEQVLADRAKRRKDERERAAQPVPQRSRPGLPCARCGATHAVRMTNRNGERLPAWPTERSSGPGQQRGPLCSGCVAAEIAPTTTPVGADDETISLVWQHCERFGLDWDHRIPAVLHAHRVDMPLACEQADYAPTEETREPWAFLGVRDTTLMWQFYRAAGVANGTIRPPQAARSEPVPMTPGEQWHDLLARHDAAARAHLDGCNECREHVASHAPGGTGCQMRREHCPGPGGLLLLHAAQLPTAGEYTAACAAGGFTAFVRQRELLDEALTLDVDPGYDWVPRHLLT